MRFLPVGRVVDLHLDRGCFCDADEEDGGEWKGQPVG